ncbi:MAG TPA: beta-ketoacyl synthase N-terminal-like domain-containing protein [Polyangiaceae bacterium]
MSSTPLWVTGVGLVTPLGVGVEATWTRLVRGDRAIRPIQRFDVSGQRTSVAGEVDGVVVEGDAWSRTSAMAATAAEEAMRNARVDVRSARVGLVVGGTTGGMLETEQLLARLHAEPEHREVLAAMLSHPLTATGDRLDERLGPFARVRSLSSACSGGANAIIAAASWLLSDEVDLVVAGGSDGLCRLTLSGFNALGALDPEPCRPFDARRKGTSLGEGAGFLVLERADRARARGARPIAALAGWAAGSEAHHITNPAPDGAVVAALVERAMARAGIAPAQVDYVNAHGTGTPLNESMEAVALARALGSEIDRIPVSSSKAQIGHTLGAAGAIEAAITALVVARKTLVPTAGLDQPDPAARVVHVPHVGRTVDRVRTALSCAFGFGGMDAALVFADPELATTPAPAHTANARQEPVITGAAILGCCGLVRGEACGNVIERRWDLAREVDAEGSLDPMKARRLDRGTRIGTIAVQAAIEDARLAEASDAGLLLGSAFGNVDGSAAFMHRIFEKGPRSASPAEFPNLVPSSPVGHASIYLGLRGPAFATADLAASGDSAVVQAVQLLRAGEAARFIAGSVEPRSDIVERVLSALFAHAPSQAGAKHTDVAAAVVLETAEAARDRGARVLARVRQTLEWRADGRAVLASLVAPSEAGAEVVLARVNGGSDALLAATPWAACRRITCAESIGESDGLGAVAIAVAAARVAAGKTRDALVLGLAKGRGFALVVSG